VACPLQRGADCKYLSAHIICPYGMQLGRPGLRSCAAQSQQWRRCCCAKVLTVAAVALRVAHCKTLGVILTPCLMFKDENCAVHSGVNVVCAARCRLCCAETQSIASALWFARCCQRRSTAAGHVYGKLTYFRSVRQRLCARQPQDALDRLARFAAPRTARARHSEPWCVPR
jgi:hypothetical protein